MSSNLKHLHTSNSYFDMDTDTSDFVSIEERNNDMELINSICETLEKLNKKYLKFIKLEEYGKVNTGLDDYKDKILNKAMREQRAKILNLQNMPRRLWTSYHDLLEVDW